MKRNGNRHLDRRRNLVPRDYASDPSLFGVDGSIGFVLPDGGDEVSMRVAHQQHRLVCAWQQSGRVTAASIARRYGTSKQTISRVRTGQRWIGETVFAALLDHVARAAAVPMASSSPSTTSSPGTSR